MSISIPRRGFLQASLAAAATPLTWPRIGKADEVDELFKISLAEWSLHRMLNNNELDNLDFPAYTTKEFGIDAIEYVNSFFKDKAEDERYLAELNKRCKSEGVKSLLIMVDGEGNLGAADKSAVI